MAQPTSSTAAPAEQQHRTPGVGQTPGTVGAMGSSPAGLAGGRHQAPDLPQPDPVLWDSFDPVLLVRLYPEAKNSDAARADALKAGKAAKEAGEHAIAAQQEPVAVPAA